MAVLVGVAGCGQQPDVPPGGSGLAAEQHRVRPGSPGTSVAAGSLDALAGVLDGWARHRWADVYAGVAVQPAAARVTVYRRPSEAFDAELHRAFPAVPVELAVAPASVRALDATVRKVEADKRDWARRGVHIVMVEADPATGRVVLRTPDLATARRLVPARYATAGIAVVAVAAVPLPTPSPALSPADTG